MPLSLREIIETNLSRTVASLFRPSADDTGTTALLDCAAERYEQFTGEDISSLSPEQQANRLWKWYCASYPFPDAEAAGRNVRSRRVSKATREEKYSFHLPYKNEESFKGNLLGSIFPDPEFIQHFCAAFRMDHDACNDFLTTCGYLPLHSKNLHNLAVYSVLSTMDTLAGNPLELIKDRYFKALTILEESSGNVPVGSLAILTQLLTKEVESVQGFDEEHYFSYIQKNAPYLNWRHSAILAEHSRLVKVFQYLYDDRQKGADWSETEANYSLFSFVNRFCKEIDHNHFGNRLIKDILEDGRKMDRENRHPTREILILLWLYEECFRCSPPIRCPKKYTASVGRTCCTSVPGLDGEPQFFFDIHRSLFGTDAFRPTVKISFEGNKYPAELYFDGTSFHRQILNPRLSEYGYSMLSESNPFDRLIMKLLTLKLYRAPLRRLDPSTGYWDNTPADYCEFCKSPPIDLSSDPDFSHIPKMYEEYHIPMALSMLFELLSHAERLAVPDLTGETSADSRRFLLPCNLSSQS